MLIINVYCTISGVILNKYLISLNTHSHKLHAKLKLFAQGQRNGAYSRAAIPRPITFSRLPRTMTFCWIVFRRNRRFFVVAGARQLNRCEGLVSLCTTRQSLVWSYTFMCEIVLRLNLQPRLYNRRWRTLSIRYTQLLYEVVRENGILTRSTFSAVVWCIVPVFAQIPQPLCGYHKCLKYAHNKWNLGSLM